MRRSAQRVFPEEGVERPSGRGAARSGLLGEDRQGAESSKRPSVLQLRCSTEKYLEQISVLAIWRSGPGPHFWEISETIRGSFFSAEQLDASLVGNIFINSWGLFLFLVVTRSCVAGKHLKQVFDFSSIGVHPCAVSLKPTRPYAQTMHRVLIGRVDIKTGGGA